MAVYVDREHFIPLRITDLVGFLASDKGAKSLAKPLSIEQQANVRKLAERLIEHFHRTFQAQFRRLKDAYAPFDPDRDTILLEAPTGAEQEKAIDQLFVEVKALLDKANYKELKKEEATVIMQGSSLWGLDLDVDWSVFERIAMYYRGDEPVTRTIRRWWKLWRKEELSVPEFGRMVLVLKQHPHKRLGKDADTSSVFMKIFKDMPKSDLEMVLPGTRIRLTKLDRGLILYPMLSGIALVLYKVLSDLLGFKDIFSITTSITLSWSFAILFAGYGYKSYTRYASKKTAYTLRVTRSLYYQLIDNNAGVFFRLLDEAEEQEVRESLLTYYYLWRHEGALSAAELDDRIEEDLEKRLELKVDFEIADGIGKVESLGLVRRVGDQYQAIPIEEAIGALESAAARRSGT